MIAVLVGVAGTVLGTIVGSALTFLFSGIATRAVERRNSRLSILSTLMANRHRVMSEEACRAVNLVPIVFHNCPTVRKSYQHYCAVFNGPYQPIMLERFKGLILSISAEMQFGDGLTDEDLELGAYLTPPTPPDPKPVASAEGIPNAVQVIPTFAQPILNPGKSGFGWIKQRFRLR